jgi:hypothetical protein
MAFNSRDYEWNDLTLILAGGDQIAIRAVKFGEKIEREPVFAKGNQPYRIQSGNITYTGEITLLKSGYDALVVAGKGSVLSLSVDGLFVFGNPNNGDWMSTNRASGIRFTEAMTEVKQGDKFIEVTLPFICLNIKQQA